MENPCNTCHVYSEIYGAPCYCKDRKEYSDSLKQVHDTRFDVFEARAQKEKDDVEQLAEDLTKAINEYRFSRHKKDFIPPIKPDPKLDVFISGEKKAEKEEKPIFSSTYVGEPFTCNHQWVPYDYDTMVNGYKELVGLRVRSFICSNCMEIKEIKSAEKKK